MKQVFWLIVIVVLAAVGIAWYTNRSAGRSLGGGEVFHHDQPGEPLKSEATGSTEPYADQTPTTAAPAGTQMAAQPVTQTVTSSGELIPPTGDTMSRNPPNGMIFAGTGRYQLYRQGDLTWRLNTDSGQACVIFATDAEWRKAKVYQHGCGNS